MSRRAALLAVLGGTAAVAGAIALAEPPVPQPPPAPRAPHLRWSAPFGTGLGSLRASAADDTTLYLSLDGDGSHALDLATGARRWTASTDAWTMIPSERVLVYSRGGLGGGLVGALDAATGRPVWELPRPSVGVDADAGTVVTVVEEGVPAESDALPMRAVALDAATGKRLWVSEQHESDPVMRAVAGGGAAYYAQAGLLTARALRSGEFRWAVPVGLDAYPIAAAEDVVFAQDDGFVAFDASTGRRRWNADWRVSRVAFVGGLVVVQTHATDSRPRLSVAHGVDPASGTVLWTVPPFGAPAGPAVSTDEHVYMSTYRGHVVTDLDPLCAYSTATGELLWSYDGGTPIAARGDDVYLILVSGELQALTGP